MIHPVSTVGPLLEVATTVATREQARALARHAVDLRLAACVQIESIESVYRWQGQVCVEPEYRVVFKTTGARYAALEAALRAQHPYEVPAIVAIPCSDALPEFAAWIVQETT